MSVGPENPGSEEWHEDKLFDESAPDLDITEDENDHPKTISPEIRLQEYAADNNGSKTEKNEQLLRDFCRDLGLNVYKYENGNSDKEDPLLEAEQDRAQIILCKIIFDTSDKRQQAIELISTKIIPSLREELEEVRDYEYRYRDNEIPRGPKKKSGELELEVRGAEALIELIASFDHPRRTFSLKRTQKEAQAKQDTIVAKEKNQKLESHRQETVRKTKAILNEARTVKRGEKEITITIDGSIMDLAQRLAQENKKKYPNAEAQRVNDRFLSGLVQYIKENLNYEQRNAMVDIYNRQERAQAKAVDRFIREAHLRELSTEKRIALERARHKLKVLQEAAGVARKTLIS